MTKTLILRNRSSASAASLAEALASKRTRRGSTTSIFPRYGLLINWGCSAYNIRLLPGQRLLNRPEAVAGAIDKRVAFFKLKENNVPAPPFFTSKEEAAQYLQETRGGIVLARTRVAGSGGDGIVVCRTQEELPNAPLYTGYIRKSAE